MAADTEHDERAIEAATDPGGEGRSSDPGWATERYRRVAELTCDYAYTFRIDADGIIAVEWLTAGFVRLCGFTRSEVASDGSTLARMIHPADLPLLRDWFSRIVSGQASAIEHRITAASGETLWVRNHGRPVRDATGRVAYVYGAVADISARVRAEQARSDESAKLQSIVDHAPLAIIAVDYAGAITTWNPVAEKLFGWKADEVLGRPNPILGPDFDFQQFIEDAFCGKLPEFDQGLRHRKDGSTVMVSASRALQRDVSGAPIGAVAMLADTTETTRAAAALRESENNFRTLIELSPDAVAVHQGQAVLYANPRMLSLMGYENDDPIGRNPLDFVHPEDRPKVIERLTKYFARGLPMPPAEERFLRRDGTTVVVEVTAIPIRFDGKQSALVHVRDLTERKRLEAQLLMADRLASVGRLAAAVGHEINNPLAYVLANVDLVLERLGNPERPLDGARVAELTQMLREARQGADRVRHIVRDLKVFSHAETEERVAVDPRRVLDSCVNMARAEIRPRAALVTRYRETPLVLGNEARLGQVLLNLLINAAHAIPGEDPDHNEIVVTTGVDERGRVLIEVRDTGVGIPMGVQKHMFEPFFTTKPHGQGTGLGLSICHNIVTALGGEIVVESEVGKGTAMRVLLPPAPVDAKVS